MLQGVLDGAPAQSREWLTGALVLGLFSGAQRSVADAPTLPRTSDGDIGGSQIDTGQVASQMRRFPRPHGTNVAPSGALGVRAVNSPGGSRIAATFAL